MEKSSINQVFAWGLGAEGQLGAEDFERSAIPIKSRISFDILEISCGGQFSGCITSDNILFMWGTNKKNQLGLIDSESKYPIPVMIKLKKPIILLSCGDWHTIILDNEGFVYGTGYNKSGCLGLGDFQNRTGFELVEDKEVGSIRF